MAEPKPIGVVEVFETPYGEVYLGAANGEAIAWVRYQYDLAVRRISMRWTSCARAARRPALRASRSASGGA